MADTTLKTRLQRLFNTQVVVRQVGKDRLKVVDTSRLQSAGNRYGDKYVDRYAGMHTNRNIGVTGIGNAYNFHAMKTQLYTDYEAMDLDPIIASALDVYADESTVKSADGDVLEIKTDNAKIKSILHNLFYDILNVEYNIWPWIRNLCKYGDLYLYLDIDEELGIVNVSPVSTYELERQENFDEENPYAVRFIMTGDNTIYNHTETNNTFDSYYNRNETNNIFESYEIAHFRLLSDTNFLPYGKSMIEPARKIFKQLTLMEDAMLLQRIMRAPERRVFKIDVGNVNPKEVDDHMQRVIDKIKKIPYIDQTTGEYNLKFNLQNMLEDYYLPVRGGDSGTTIDTLPGLSNDGQIDDIEYLRNKLMAALKIPKAFLGYDEGVEGKSTLAAEDVRFARTIERIQKVVLSELYKIAVVHLFVQGYHDSDLVNFELNLTSPSIIYERQKVELLKEKIDLAASMVESKMFSFKYIYENIFNMSQEQWKNESELVVTDAKQLFRLEQILSEGNDPKITKQSFGTPHDIASMHVSTKFDDPRTRDNIPGPGRNPVSTNFESDRDIDGPDPLGIKDISNTYEPMDVNTNTNVGDGRSDNINDGIIRSPLSNFIKYNLGNLKLSSVKKTLNESVDNKELGTYMDESELDKYI